MREQLRNRLPRIEELTPRHHRDAGFVCGHRSRRKPRTSAVSWPTYLSRRCSTGVRFSSISRCGHLLENPNAQRTGAGNATNRKRQTRRRLPLPRRRRPIQYSPAIETVGDHLDPFLQRPRSWHSWTGSCISMRRHSNGRHATLETSVIWARRRSKRSRGSPTPLPPGALPTRTYPTRCRASGSSGVFAHRGLSYYHLQGVLMAELRCVLEENFDIW